MKRKIIRIISFLMCTIFVLGILASCSKEPYDYDLTDYIKVPEASENVTVTHDEILSAVNEKIKAVLKNKSTLNTVTRRATTGDLVKLGFKCYKTDEKKTEITDISDSDCSLILGDGKYPFELESSIMKRSAGEFYAVRVMLPDTFTANELAGKQVIYEVEIKEIREFVPPEYNDEFVKEISVYQTVDEYEQYLYGKMKEELIFDKLLSMCSVRRYPVSEVQSYTSSFVKYYTERAEELKLTLEQYAAKKFFVNMTDFHLKADAYAKELVKKEMLLYALVEMYDISLDDAEYTAGAQRYAAEYGLASVSKLEAKFGTVYVRQSVLMDKTLGHIASMIEVVGAPHETDDTDNSEASDNTELEETA